MRFRYYILLLLPLVWLACNHQHSHRENEDSTNRISGLRLNEGAKWAADLSTYSGMQRLQDAVRQFSASHPSPQLTDYHRLGDELAAINADIIRQCSMKGADHDQLHLLLEPMLRQVDVIKNSSDPAATRDSLAALEKNIGLFFRYFEIKE